MNSASGTAVRKPYGADAVRKNARGLIAAALICIAIIFMIVSLNAYAATLQCANNKLQSENEYLQAEIDAMENQIVEQTKVTRIEKIATGKYGMVYPTADNCITIDGEEQTGENLAATIKAEAYN